MSTKRRVDKLWYILLQQNTKQQTISNKDKSLNQWQVKQQNAKKYLVEVFLFFYQEVHLHKVQKQAKLECACSFTYKDEGTIKKIKSKEVAMVVPTTGYVLGKGDK